MEIVMSDEGQVVIAIGIPSDRVEEAFRIFSGATVVAAPSLEAAVQWLEEAAHAASVHAAPLRVDGLEIDVDDHRVTCFGTPVDFTEQEVRILGCLASEPGRARTFKEIFVGSWAQRYMNDPSPVQAAVKRLRAKLGRAGAGVRIEAVRAIGYRMVVPPLGRSGLE